MKFWDEKNERLNRVEIEQLQIEKLQSTLNRVYKNVSHYRKLFKEIDFLPEDITSLKDLKKLPFTTRTDLINNYPYGMFAVPLREVVRLHAPPFSLDKPVALGFTKNDLNIWAQLMARNFTAIGVNKDDVVQISLHSGITTGHYGISLGAQLIGASVMPISFSKLQSQAKFLRDFRTTTLVSTPTSALSLSKTIDEMGINLNSLSLKYAIFGSEPWSEETRVKIEEILHIRATDTYGLTEVFGPGVAWECSEKKGLHISEDHFIPEIINPKTLNPVPIGNEGELVLTTISKEAFPLVRYRTGDLTVINYETCPCGRTHCRISRMNKRIDDVFVMRGMSIIPEQIGQILEQINKAKTNYQLVVERKNYKDILTILMEVSDKIFFHQMKRQTQFLEEIHNAVSEFLGWEIQVKLVEPGAFDTNQKVIDKRQI